MPKSMERDLKSIDSRMLYRSKRSGSHQEEPAVLLSATARTSEFIRPGSAPTGPEGSDDGGSGDVNGDRSKMATPPNSPLPVNGGGDTGDPDKPADSFPRGQPFLAVPPSLLSNQLLGNRKPDDGGGGKSVFVNLSSGSGGGNGNENVDGDGSNNVRLSQILDEVQRNRQQRERHHSFGSKDSLEMERTKENILRRLDMLKSSKRRLLFKYRIYEFLKRPSTFWATIYHVVAFILVMACLVVSVFPNMDRFLDEWGGKQEALYVLENIVVIWFAVEYLLRLWSCNCRPQYQGCRGKWNFFKAPAHLIDLLVILLSVAVMFWPHEGHEVFAFRAFRGFHRFFQVAQIIITKRQLRPWRFFLSVLYDQREQLMIIFYLEFILFAFLAYLGFLVEHQHNDMLDSVAECVWWSIITLTTVGYGDKVPITWRGKIISSVFILFGFCVFALPAGIIGAGLALKLEQVEQSRSRRKKVDAAARLIQRAWHCYRDCQTFQQLSSFFGQGKQSEAGELYRNRIYETISHAFVSVVRFHVAKSDFKQLTRSVDLRNVVESYKYGQMDIFSRLKELNATLDTVLTRMAAAEQERTYAVKRLIQQLNLPEDSTLIQTKDAIYTISPVNGSSSKSNDDDSTRAQKDHKEIPYIDWDGDEPDVEKKKLRQRRSNSDRRHSK